MKKLLSLVLVAISLCLHSCASLDDQIKSRELLGKCQYELKRVEVENLDFDKMIEVANSAKQIDFKNPDKEVVPLLNDIKNLNFDVNFSTLDFATTIGVKNPNAHPVILDSLVFDAFMDDIKVTNVIHDGVLNIPANSEGELRLVFAMPTSYKLKNLLAAENVNLQGKVWLKIELIKGLPITIPFPFNVKQKIPREQIQAMVDDQKKKVVEKIVKELAGDKVNSIIKKF
jgi:LEA14-like dessication related protein